ncbi:MAG: patatin family protein [Clostridiales bacterium]|nr:patatin family protein [Clostridiales bacterium]
MSKKGLILEGGALRGLFTMGILDTFLDEGIVFDGVVGVSAGVAFGCNYKSEQKGRALRYNQKYNKEWRFKGWRSLITTGDLFGADFCYDKLPKELDPFDYKTFEDNKMDFWAVASDCETGEAVYYKLRDGKDEDMQWIRASASMPLASKPVIINGRKYLDGGLADSIPLKFMEDQGFTKNVVILTQPSDYVKKPYPKLASAALHNLPKTAELVRNRHSMYNAQTEYVKQRAEQNEAFIICPPEPLNIGSLERDPEQMQRVYDTGCKTAQDRMEEMLKYLSS